MSISIAACNAQTLSSESKSKDDTITESDKMKNTLKKIFLAVPLLITGCTSSNASSWLCPPLVALALTVITGKLKIEPTSLVRSMEKCCLHSIV